MSQAVKKRANPKAKVRAIRIASPDDGRRRRYRRLGTAARAATAEEECHRRGLLPPARPLGAPRAYLSQPLPLRPPPIRNPASRPSPREKETGLSPERKYLA